jgi:uncharacterized OsmC-like protein
MTETVRFISGDNNTHNVVFNRLDIAERQKNFNTPAQLFLSAH